MSTSEKIEKALKHPVSWAAGAVGSVAAVGGAVVGDPTGAIAAIASVAVDQASMVFTASSIAGFTLAPQVPGLPAGLFETVAIIAGVVVVLKIAGKLWDALKRRFINE